MIKCLSIRQPWATLICSGIKKVENRTWSTKEREFYIHASSNEYNFNDILFKNDDLPLFKSFYKNLNLLRSGKDINADEIILFYKKDKGYEFYINENIEIKNEIEIEKEYKFLKDVVACSYDAKNNLFPTHAIIGKSEIEKITKNTENTDMKFSEKNCYNYILKNACFINPFIENVKGKLKFWEYIL